MWWNFVGCLNMSDELNNCMLDNIEARMIRYKTSTFQLLFCVSLIIFLILTHFQTRKEKLQGTKKKYPFSSKSWDCENEKRRWDRKSQYFNSYRDWVELVGKCPACRQNTGRWCANRRYVNVRDTRRILKLGILGLMICRKCWLNGSVLKI